MAPQASAGQGEQRCTFQRLDPGHWTPRETRRTVGCFAGKFGVSVSKALHVVGRESRFHARAINRTGCGGYGCLGAFQMHARYYPGWMRAADDALKRWQVKKRKWANPRVSAVVALAKVRRDGGWSAWSVV